jgi:hypothetical protein
MTTISALSHVPDFVIEEHVASTNQFLQVSRLTLDDLNVYAQPLSDAVQLVMRGAHHPVSDDEIIEVVRRAMKEYMAIDDDLLAVAAADAEGA